MCCFLGYFILRFDSGLTLVVTRSGTILRGDLQLNNFGGKGEERKRYN